MIARVRGYFFWFKTYVMIATTLYLQSFETKYLCQRSAARPTAYERCPAFLVL